MGQAITTNTTADDSVMSVIANVIGASMELPPERIMQAAMQGTLIHKAREFYSRHPEKLGERVDEGVQ